MGFRQKSRGIRFGFLEYIALLLAGLTVAMGVGWRGNASRAQWVTLPAQVDAVSLVENTHVIEASRPSIRVHFNYVVHGRVYGGATRFGGLSRMLYGTLPSEIKQLLQTKGYLSFKDLPPNIQQLLKKKGVSSFNQVPQHVLDALRAQGYHSVKEFPEDVERLARSSEYRKVAEAAGFSAEDLAALSAFSEKKATANEQSQAEKRPQDGVAGTTKASRSAPRSATETRSVPIPTVSIIRVRYDPTEPARHEVVRIPFINILLSTWSFFVVALIALFYCGVIYPRLKQR